MPAAAQRVIVPEWLDVAEPTDALDSLADLVRINRYLGGYRTLRWMLSKVTEPALDFSLLDVGAASGDMGAKIRMWRPRARVVALDRKPNHLAAGEGPKVIGDAFHLPFDDKSFDFVFSSLFLHHFEDAQVVKLFSEFRRIARRAVLAIDLERGPLAYHFIPSTKWVFRWDPITLHDAPISVEAAFKAQELRSLAERAGLTDPKVRVHRPWSRLSLIAPV